MTTKYNHMFSICFELENESKEGEATEEELLKALTKRLTNLRGSKGEIIEATGYPDDTYQI